MRRKEILKKSSAVAAAMLAAALISSGAVQAAEYDPTEVSEKSVEQSVNETIESETEKKSDEIQPENQEQTEEDENCETVDDVASTQTSEITQDAEQTEVGVEENNGEDVMDENEELDSDTKEEEPVAIAEEEKNGWQEENGCWYYYENGEKATGIVEIGGKQYFFELQDGELQTDSKCYLNDAVYRTDSNGVLISGWYGNYTWEKEYYEADGKGANGYKTIDGKNYYFEDGRLLSETFLADSYLYIISESGEVVQRVSASKNGWIAAGDEWYYAQNGELVKGQWLEVKGKKYRLDTDGKMLSNQRYRDYLDNEKYYQLSKDGSVVTGIYIDDCGDLYLYLEDGSAASGIVQYKGKTYYAYTKDDDYWKCGKLAVSKNISANGKNYHADASGVCTEVKYDSDGWKSDKRYYIENGSLVTGWKKISGKWYYFDKNSGEKTVNTERKIDGKTYCFNSEGIMQTGWIAKEGGAYYYAKSDGSLVENGWLKTGNVWYYFQSCYMVRGAVKIDGKEHFFKDSGAWTEEIAEKYTGWKQAGTEWYYYDNGVKVQNMIKTIRGQIYRFDLKGQMLRNVSDGVYYFNASGAALKSKWQQCNVKDQYGYYRNQEGWQYYGADGKRKENGWQKINSVWYYFQSADKDGVAVSGDVVIDNILYHFNSDCKYTGKSETIKNGWNFINGYWYYYENGTAARYETKKINGAIYQFDFDSKMIAGTSWSEYYYDENGKRVTKEGWYLDHTKYVTSEGKLAANGVYTIGGKRYYFSGTTCMKQDMISDDKTVLYEINPDTGELTKVIEAFGTGWKKTANGNWFYCRNGKFLSYTHCKINGKTYLFGKNGEMQVNNGVTQNDGYYDQNGELQTDGWCQDNYFRDGRRVHGAQIIEGKYYYFLDGTGGKGGVEFSVNTPGVYWVDGNYYYYNGKGNRQKVSAKKGWIQLPDGNWCYAVDGKLQYKPTLVNGKMYYFNAETGLMLRNAWAWLNEGIGYKWRYIDNNGNAVKNKWVTSQGDAVYSDGTYIFYTESDYPEITVKSGTYYLDENGYAVSGQRVINNHTYLFSESGKLQKQMN